MNDLVLGHSENMQGRTEGLICLWPAQSTSGAPIQD